MAKQWLSLQGFNNRCDSIVASNPKIVALGNIVGSNIYNLCGILGLTALIHPIEVPAEIAAFDIWVMLGVTALLIVQLRSGWRLTRIEGALLVALYAGYTAFLALR